MSADTIEQFMNALASTTGLDNEIKNWIYGYIKAKDYRVEILRGKFDLNSNNPLISKLYGKATAVSPVVKFHPNLPAATASSVDVIFENSGLKFDIKDPKYQGANAIVNLSINELINKPNLIVPHPLMHLRAFVLVPMLEIAEDFVHPFFGKTVESLFEAIDEPETVCLYGTRL